MGAKCPIPALAITTSIFPQSDSTDVTASTISEYDRTSTAIVFKSEPADKSPSAFVKLSCDLPVMHTLYPMLKRDLATSRPMPLLPPVINATFFIYFLL